MTEKRIFGLETEYALCVESSDRQLQAGDAGTLFRYLENALLAAGIRTLESDSFGRQTAASSDGIVIREGRFLEAGARFYYDTGHLEWATPETLSGTQAALYELAGERTLEELARRVDIPEGGRLLLVKNNVDYLSGTTYGCHENYRVIRGRTKRADRLFFSRLVKQLAPFLVTRQIYAGAGKIGAGSGNGKPIGYQISQRADFIENLTSKETRGERAIINLRDESLGDDRYRRLHLIVGDSNRSPFATALKLGATGLVLRLIEGNFLRRVPVLARPVKAVRSVSRDLSCREPIPLVDGGAASPIEVQRYYLRQAEDRFGNEGGETLRILERWRRVLGDLEEDPDRLADRIDWVTKRRYLLDSALAKANTDWSEVASWSEVLERLDRDSRAPASAALPTPRQCARYQFLMSRNHLDWSDYPVQRRLYFELRERDLRYHDIDSERGLFAALRRANLLASTFAEREIEAACQEPPSATRARLRAEVIRWAHRHGHTDDTLLDWGRVSLPGAAGRRRTVHIDDPFVAESGYLIQVLRQSTFGPPQSDASKDSDLEIRVLDVEYLESQTPIAKQSFWSKLGRLLGRDR